LLDGEAPEPRPSDLAGKGTWEDPLRIDALPFVDDRDTTKSETSVVDQYGSCSMANEGGPEVVYRLELASAKKLRIRVFDGAGVDIDVQFMQEPGGKDHCIARADRILDVDAGPGTFFLSADTFVDAQGALPGPYLITVVER
jgi:hypothetical protein